MMILRSLDRATGWLVASAKWLALPLIALLFLQWPLRDIVRGWSREANDLGQIAFALFVALSVTAATRAQTHLAADLVAQRYSERTRAWLARAGAALGLLPWAVFVLIASRTSVLTSLGVREVVPGLRQSRLFPDQARALAHGGSGDRSGADRYFPRRDRR